MFPDSVQYSTVITNDIIMTSCFLTACVTVVACYATKVSLLLKQAENCPSLRVVIKLGGDITEEEKEEAFKNPGNHVTYLRVFVDKKERLVPHLVGEEKWERVNVLENKQS